MASGVLLVLGIVACAVWFLGVLIGVTLNNYIYILLPIGVILLLAGGVTKAIFGAK